MSARRISGDSMRSSTSRVTQSGRQLQPCSAAFFFATLRARHIGQVDLKDFAVLQAQHQLLTRRVIFLDARLAKRRIDKRLLFGRAALKVLVRLELVAQAAHQAAADATNLGRVERQVLLLCHADRNRLKLSAKARAAELLAALGIAAHQAGLVAHADLAHVDANVQRRGQVLDELTEIDALLGRKVEHSLLAAKQVLDADRLHLEVELFDQTTEIDHGLVALDGQVVGKLQVDVARHAQHGLERLAISSCGTSKGSAVTRPISVPRSVEQMA